MNLLCYKDLKALFSDFRNLKVRDGLFWKRKSMIHYTEKKCTTGLVELAAVMAIKFPKSDKSFFKFHIRKTPKLMQLLRQTKTLMWVTVLAANFSDAVAVGAVSVYLATTTKTWLAAPTEAIFFRCSLQFEEVFTRPTSALDFHFYFSFSVQLKSWNIDLKYLTHQIENLKLDFENSEIHWWIFRKNSKIFKKNCQKCIQIRLG
jgi:hypothetical protein